MTAAESDVSLQADLPTLPEVVERWISRVEAGDMQTVSLSRRTSKRFTRHAAWKRDGDDDLHQWVVARCTAYCTEYGDAVFALATGDEERLAWLASIADHESDVVLPPYATQAQLVSTSWQLTFKAANMMLKATSAAPRLMEQVVGSHRDSMKALAEVTRRTDSVELAQVQAAAGEAKLDRIMQFLGMTFKDGGGGSTSVVQGTTDVDAARVSRLLLRALQPEEVAAVMLRPVGPALAVVDDWDVLQELIDALWGEVKSGELALSGDTLEKCRAIIQEHQPG